MTSTFVEVINLDPSDYVYGCKELFLEYMKEIGDLCEGWHPVQDVTGMTDLYITGNKLFKYTCYKGNERVYRVDKLGNPEELDKDFINYLKGI